MRPSTAISALLGCSPVGWGLLVGPRYPGFCPEVEYALSSVTPPEATKRVVPSGFSATSLPLALVPETVEILPRSSWPPFRVLKSSVGQEMLYGLKPVSTVHRRVPPRLVVTTVPPEKPEGNAVPV